MRALLFQHTIPGRVHCHNNSACFSASSQDLKCTCRKRWHGRNQPCLPSAPFGAWVLTPTLGHPGLFLAKHFSCRSQSAKRTARSRAPPLPPTGLSLPRVSSLAAPATDILTPTTVDGRFRSSGGRNRTDQDYVSHNHRTGGARRRPHDVHGQGGSNQGSKGRSSDCGSDYELDIRFPPPPPPRAPVSAATAAVNAAASCRKGVQADYGGVQDVDQLVRRVEASARAVSRENEDIIKVVCYLY